MSANRCIPLAGLALAAALTGRPAAADAIYGKWCFSDGRLMAINGPRITTPAGTLATGDYDRHAFIYTVPARDPDAGVMFFMVMLDEDTIHVSAHAWPGAADAGPTQTWFRCAGPTS